MKRNKYSIKINNDEIEVDLKKTTNRDLFFNHVDILVNNWNLIRNSLIVKYEILPEIYIKSIKYRYSKVTKKYKFLFTIGVIDFNKKSHNIEQVIFIDNIMGIFPKDIDIHNYISNFNSIYLFHERKKLLKFKNKIQTDMNKQNLQYNVSFIHTMIDDIIEMESLYLYVSSTSNNPKILNDCINIYAYINALSQNMRQIDMIIEAYKCGGNVI